MFVRQIPDGTLYVCRSHERGRIGRVGKEKPYRNWFLLKYQDKNVKLTINSILFPKSFAGKKIRLKIEVLDEL